MALAEAALSWGRWVSSRRQPRAQPFQPTPEVGLDRQRLVIAGERPFIALQFEHEAFVLATGPGSDQIL